MTVTPTKPGKLLRLPLVEEMCCRKKSSIYAGWKKGTFPAPLKLSARSIAWRSEDIEAWIAARPTADSK
jgi:prophage regulatory protein